VRAAKASERAAAATTAEDKAAAEVEARAERLEVKACRAAALAARADTSGAEAAVAEAREEAIAAKAAFSKVAAKAKEAAARAREAKAKAAAPRVSFAELFGQPRSFRGRLVRMKGVFHRAEELTAPANSYGIDRYWQGWLEPAGGPVSPVVVQFLKLPEGMPTARPMMFISGPSRRGEVPQPRASVWKASTISASPASTARRSPKARCTDGLPRRVGASSKQGRSSWTRDAQCSSSIAAAADSAISGLSSPQAQATARVSRGRMRAPPGNTE
jgi:hypothetical protein